MRLIDAECDELMETAGPRVFNTRQDIRKWLARAPTVDAVVVTRCKDCEYCRKLSLKNRLEGGYAENVLWCMNHSYGVWPTDFCSYGKRKENK